MELIYSYSVVEEGFVAQHIGRYGWSLGIGYKNSSECTL